MKIHSLLWCKAKTASADLLEQYNQADTALAEARSLGDLSENSEYDAAIERKRKTSKALDELQLVLDSDPIELHHSNTIYEGCVIEISVWGMTPTQMPEGEYFAKSKEEGVPVFEGKIAFGGSTSAHTLLSDFVLSAKSPVGQYLIGHPVGDYSIKLADGFVNLTVHAIHNDVTQWSDLSATFRGAE